MVDNQQAISILASGNPGALAVLLNGDKLYTNFVALIIAHELKGSDIWVAFKDHCGQDFREFHEKLSSGYDFKKVSA